MHAQEPIATDIPARLDALHWNRFHALVIAALGITWILDGLEVTIAGSIAGALQSSPVLHLSASQIGLSASAYLFGAVAGALIFGWLADRYGRRRLFNITLGLYLCATALTALSTSPAFFIAMRALTGAGIGGEYAAINSALQELIPARYRGRTDLLVNGSFWIGAAFGALGAVVLLQPRLFPPDIGWRIAFGIGAALGLAILWLRRFIPESPRWLMTHRRHAEAEAILVDIESRCSTKMHGDLERPPPIRLVDRSIGMLEVARTLFKTYPRRSLYCLVLMASQAFFYNAIFFTYALVLGKFFGIDAASVGLYILPFAAGNFLGPLVLGKFFDSIGRRPMIAGTYAASGILLLVTALLFVTGRLDVVSQTIAWSVVFFFASAAASSAYLTVGESFPLEMRALAIALFYAFGTALGGVIAPWVFSLLIGTGERIAIGYGYAFGAALMCAAAFIALKIGIPAERRSLEHVTPPLTSLDASH